MINAAQDVCPYGKIYPELHNDINGKFQYMGFTYATGCQLGSDFCTEAETCPYSKFGKDNNVPSKCELDEDNILVSDCRVGCKYVDNATGTCDGECERSINVL